MSKMRGNSVNRFQQVVGDEKKKLPVNITGGTGKRCERGRTLKK